MNNLDRRKFLVTAGLAALATTAFGFSKPPLTGEANCAPIKGSLMHQVYYWLKNPESEADKQKLIKGLQELVTVKQIKYAHVGVPQVFKADDQYKGYHVSLLMVFDKPGDIDVYHKDDIHQKFVSECKDLWVKTVKYDALAV